jgi:hypothetical protein
MEEVRLERLAVEVPDLDTWIARFESVLGSGFQKRSVRGLQRGRPAGGPSARELSKTWT